MNKKLKLLLVVIVSGIILNGIFIMTGAHEEMAKDGVVALLNSQTDLKITRENVDKMLIAGEQIEKRSKELSQKLNISENGDFSDLPLEKQKEIFKEQIKLYKELVKSGLLDINK